MKNGQTDVERAAESERDIQRNQNIKKGAREICYIAMFVAIMAVCSWLSVNIGEIPITLQTMGMCLAGGLLGWKRGGIAVLAYILLGLVGVPVFSGFTGGVAKLVSPTGGYIIGFIFTALIVGVTSDLVQGKKIGLRLGALVAAMIVGIAVCYVFGTGWFICLYIKAHDEVTFVGALSYALTKCVLPFILPDLVKIAVAAVLTERLRKYMKIDQNREKGV
jgi:biotin transport system substrate-specific component